MSSVLDLLGLNYEQLGASEALRGAEIPERERIEDQSYVSIFPKGISFVLPNHMSVGAIQFHAAGHEGFLGYDQSLPFDLDFHMSREAVRQLLGNPNRPKPRSESVSNVS